MNTENMEIKSNELQKQIEDLKNKLKSVKKAERNEAKKKAKEEAKEVIVVEKEKKEPVDRKTYMREYMRRYKEKNPVQEKNRRNTGYYVKKFNISKEFKEEFGVNTCKIHKAIEAMKHIKTNYPELYPKLFQYI